MLGVPGLTRRTCKRGRAEVHLVPAQVDQLGGPQPVAVGHEDHSGVPVSPAVLLARAISRSTSASVKYSRVRSLLLGGRFGVTVRFTVLGVTSLRCRLAMRCALPAM